MWDLVVWQLLCLRLRFVINLSAAQVNSIWIEEVGHIFPPAQNSFPPAGLRINNMLREPKVKQEDVAEETRSLQTLLLRQSRILLDPARETQSFRPITTYSLEFHIITAFIHAGLSLCTKNMSLLTVPFYIHQLHYVQNFIIPSQNDTSACLRRTPWKIRRHLSSKSKHVWSRCGSWNTLPKSMNKEERKDVGGSLWVFCNIYDKIAILSARAAPIWVTQRWIWLADKWLLFPNKIWIKRVQELLIGDTVQKIPQ